MMQGLASYLPRDRFFALVRGEDLPEYAVGAVLFADISGFTLATATIARVFGPQRGAEELLGVLNPIYAALIDEVDRYGGSVISFSGDGVTCWFADAALGAARATACALALHQAIQPFYSFQLPNKQEISIGLKVSVASGRVRRFLVGDPDVQRIEILAGLTIARLGLIAELTNNGEVLIDTATATHLAGQAIIAEWRVLPDGTHCALLVGLNQPIAAQPWPALPLQGLSDSQLKPWLLPPVYTRLAAGQGEFLTELRHTISLFLHFADLDYDNDPQAAERLNAFVYWVQQVLIHYQGWLLQLNIGDKGCYMHMAFGTPIAYGDDTMRAVSAAIALGMLPPALSYAAPLAIGISGGLMWAGAMGGSARTYNVMGDAANMAARLMQAASPGQILMSAHLASTVSRRYQLEPLPAIQVKGKPEPLSVVVVTTNPIRQASLEEPQYPLPLIDRNRELERIDDLIEQVQRGVGQVLCVTGEAGMGKSRLVSELAKRAQRVGMLVYGGAAQAMTSRKAYAAWQMVWQSFFGLTNIASTDEQIDLLANALQQLSPILRGRLPLLGEVLHIPIPDNELTRSLLLAQRKDALEALLVDCLRLRVTAAQSSPVVLVIEDVHWLDPLSRDLIVAMSRAITALPVLLVITYRPPELDAHSQSWLDELPNRQEIHLGEMSLSDATTLITQQLALLFGIQEPPSEEFVRAINERAEGKPFYIEELLNYLRDRGITPSDALTMEQMELPTSLSSLILSRLDQLPAQQQTIAKVASLIGRVFAIPWLWGAYPYLGAFDQVYQDIEGLARVDVTSLHKMEPVLSYMFKHATIQEVAYESLPFAQRAQLHDQLAAWLEGQFPAGEQLDLLAYHYGRGTNRAKQREFFQKAGDAAMHQYANQAAVQYYERLLDLQEPGEQFTTLLALGQVLERIGQWDAAEARYHEAIVVAKGLNDLARQAQALIGLGVVQRLRSRLDAAAEYFGQARSLYISLGDKIGVSNTLLELAFLHFWQGKADSARIYAEESLALGDFQNDPQRVARSYGLIGQAAYLQRNIDEARDWLNQSLAIRREIGDKPGVANMLTNLALYAFEQQRYGETRELLNQVLPMYQEMGARWPYGRARQLSAITSAMQGDSASAKEAYRETFALFRELEGWIEIAEGLLDVMMATYLTDRSEQALLFAVQIGAAGAYHSQRLGRSVPQTLRHQMELVRTEAIRLVGERKVNAVFAAGEAMDQSQALKFALDWL